MNLLNMNKKKAGYRVVQQKRVWFILPTLILPTLILPTLILPILILPTLIFPILTELQYLLLFH